MKITKKLSLSLAAAALLLIGVGTANAQQQKFGYINSQELIASMPESDSVRVQLATLGNDLESQFTSMREEFERKSKEFTNGLSTMAETIRKQKEKELFDLQSRLEEFQQSAQQELQAKQMELFRPVMEKAQAAVTKVAKEQGLIAVFDLGTGALAYYSESEMINVLPLVQRSLGITK